MSTALGAVLVIAALVIALALFVFVARVLRHRMRTRTFRGFQSAIGGSAYMGAPRDDAAPPTSPEDARWPPTVTTSEEQRILPPYDGRGELE